MTDRQGPLRTEDVEYLDANYPGRWSLVREGEVKCGLEIREFPLSDGYEPSASTLMIIVPSGYPGVPLDMFYLHPPVIRRDGDQIDALADEIHFDTTWQRWSRHYNWLPGRDNLVRHIERFRNLVAAELVG